MYKLNGLRPQTLYARENQGIGGERVRQALTDAFGDMKSGLKKVLLIPPDFTRLHSKAGLITRLLYDWLSPDCRVDILPALGTHVPLGAEQWRMMFEGVPIERMLVHHWRDKVVKLGDIPGDFVAEVSGGLMKQPIPVEISRYLIDPSYDLIISIGQVVPHEVAGMANHAKNIFIGCGGAGIINASHMLGAVCGMESIMGRDRTPVRALLDYMAEHFTRHLPICYALTVTTAVSDDITLHGLFIGSERSAFEQAVALSQQKNIVHLDRAIGKCVVMLDEREFHSTWIGNKAVYRTRMAIRDGGELVILAPGVKRFGEDSAVDALLRKYGYRGRDFVLRAVETQEDLKSNLSAAAHLIHGSSDGRFKITYCTSLLSQEEVEGVGYAWRPLDEALREYAGLGQGWNTLPGGEEVYYIQNPALGLWMAEDRA